MAENQDNPRYVSTITDDWLPLPERLLGGLQWRDGDKIEIEVIGDALVLTRIEESDEKNRSKHVVGTGTVRIASSRPTGSK